PAWKPDWLGGMWDRAADGRLRVRPRVHDLRNIRQPISAGTWLHSLAGKLGMGAPRHPDALFLTPSVSGRETDFTSLVVARPTGGRGLRSRHVPDLCRSAHGSGRLGPRQR